MSRETRIGADLWPALRRLDALLARAVERTTELTGTAPGADPFRGLYLAHDDVARSLTREPGDPIGIDAMDESQPAGALAAVAAYFGLTSFDLDLLVIALAPEVDLRYERVYAYLQDDVTRRRPSVDLSLSLLCGSAEEKLARRAHLAHYAPLVRHRLVEVGNEDVPLLAQPLAADAQIAGALIGGGGLDRRCAAFTTLSWPARGFDELSLRAAAREHIRIALNLALERRTPLRLALHGRARSGQRGAAEAIAAAAGAALVAVDGPAVMREPEPAKALRLVFRERWLRGGVLLLDGVDSLDAAALTTELTHDGGIVVLAGHEPWRPPVSEQAAPLALVDIELLPPDANARRREWAAAGVELPAGDLDELAERFVLTAPQIQEAAASAWARGSDPTREGLFAEARAQSAQRLGTLARRIAPSASWDDLVVPDDVLAQLRELASWVANRQRVLGDWGFAQRLSRGRGATALFAGAAGTGKTLAAEVVAGELGLDLYRIDLSGVVSKYIGETEKNLARIFGAAEDANAVLLFDEADALFGKRSEVSDAHDRYANIEISYLLQKMEEYEGVAILATNLRDNLDQAFTRRLAFIVTFPFPAEDERRRIWELVWPGATPLAGDLDFDALADGYRLSGGQIKNVALAAAYLAAGNGGEVSREHLEAALMREYEKLGRAPRELEPVG